MIDLRNGDRRLISNGYFHNMTPDRKWYVSIKEHPPRDGSHKSTHLAFVHSIDNLNDGFFLGNVDSSPTSPPKWSPDGTKIAYIHDLCLYFANSNGRGKRIQFTGKKSWRSGRTYSFSWSPDGNSLVCHAMITTGLFTKSVSVLYMIDLPGNTTTILSEGNKDTYPIWSPQ